MAIYYLKISNHKSNHTKQSKLQAHRMLGNHINNFINFKQLLIYKKSSSCKVRSERNQLKTSIMDPSQLYLFKKILKEHQLNLLKITLNRNELDNCYY